MIIPIEGKEGKRVLLFSDDYLIVYDTFEKEECNYVGYVAVENVSNGPTYIFGCDKPVRRMSIPEKNKIYEQICKWYPEFNDYLYHRAYCWWNEAGEMILEDDGGRACEIIIGDIPYVPEEYYGENYYFMYENGDTPIDRPAIICSIETLLKYFPDEVKRYHEKAYYFGVYKKDFFQD